MLATSICVMSWGLGGGQRAKTLETYKMNKSKKVILRLVLELCT